MDPKRSRRKSKQIDAPWSVCPFSASPWPLRMPCGLFSKSKRGLNTNNGFETNGVEYEYEHGALQKATTNNGSEANGVEYEPSEG